MAASSNSGKRNTSGNSRAKTSGAKSSGGRGKSGSTRAASGQKSTNSRKTSGNRTSSRAQGGRNNSVMDEEVYRLPPERIREIYLFVYFAINLVLILGTYGICGKL